MVRIPYFARFICLDGTLDVLSFSVELGLSQRCTEDFDPLFDFFLGLISVTDVVSLLIRPLRI